MHRLSASDEKTRGRSRIGEKVGRGNWLTMQKNTFGNRFLSLSPPSPFSLCSCSASRERRGGGSRRRKGGGAIAQKSSQPFENYLPPLSNSCKEKESPLRKGRKCFSSFRTSLQGCALKYKVSFRMQQGLLYVGLNVYPCLLSIQPASSLSKKI